MSSRTFDTSHSAVPWARSHLYFEIHLLSSLHQFLWSCTQKFSAKGFKHQWFSLRVRLLSFRIYYLIHRFSSTLDFYHSRFKSKYKFIWKCHLSVELLLLFPSFYHVEEHRIICIDYNETYRSVKCEFLSNFRGVLRGVWIDTFFLVPLRQPYYSLCNDRKS